MQSIKLKRVWYKRKCESRNERMWRRKETYRGEKLGFNERSVRRQRKLLEEEAMRRKVKEDGGAGELGRGQRGPPHCDVALGSHALPKLLFRSFFFFFFYGLITNKQLIFVRQILASSTVIWTLVKRLLFGQKKLFVKVC